MKIVSGTYVSTFELSELSTRSANSCVALKFLVREATILTTNADLELLISLTRRIPQLRDKVRVEQDNLESRVDHCT